MKVVVTSFGWTIHIAAAKPITVPLVAHYPFDDRGRPSGSRNSAADGWDLPVEHKLTIDINEVAFEPYINPSKLKEVKDNGILLGKGAFGKVVQATHPVTENPLAVKVIKVRGRSEEEMSDIFSELYINHLLSSQDSLHPCIAKPVAIGFDQRSIQAEIKVNDTVKKCDPDYYLRTKEYTVVAIITKDDALARLRAGTLREGREICTTFFESWPVLKGSDKVYILRDVSNGNEWPACRSGMGMPDDSQWAYVVMEKVPGDDLYGLELTPEHKMLIYAQFISVLKYLQDLNIAHRDLKIKNARFCLETGVLTLLDLGLARVMLDPETRSVGTVKIRPPEMFRNHPHTTKADIWSLGVAIAELETGKNPVVPAGQELAEDQMLRNIDGMNLTKPNMFSRNRKIQKFVVAMMDPNPDSRNFENAKVWAEAFWRNVVPKVVNELARNENQIANKHIMSLFLRLGAFGPAKAAVMQQLGQQSAEFIFGNARKTSEGTMFGGLFGQRDRTIDEMKSKLGEFVANLQLQASGGDDLIQFLNHVLAPLQAYIDHLNSTSEPFQDGDQQKMGLSPLRLVNAARSQP